VHSPRQVDDGAPGPGAIIDAVAPRLIHLTSFSDAVARMSAASSTIPGGVVDDGAQEARRV
jgi:hypothetical protein